MELTILLAKVIGLYLIIGGASIMLRERHFIPVVGAFVEERLTRLIVGMLELIAGLFLVVAHTNWSSLPAGILTVFGWALVIEGTLYLILPDESIEKMIKRMNVTGWYIAGGIFAIALGTYLAGFGFGWL